MNPNSIRTIYAHATQWQALFTADLPPPTTHIQNPPSISNLWTASRRPER